MRSPSAPTPGSGLAVALPTVLLTAALMLTCVLGLDTVSTARAYVAAEGLWSNSTRAALAALERCVLQGRRADLQRFQQALEVPLALQHARKALDATGLPISAAAKHFVDAGLAREDAVLMAYVYRLARDMAWTHATVMAWQGYGEQGKDDELLVGGQATAKRHPRL